MQANAGIFKMPVAILNHAYIGSLSDRSFLANYFAVRGYLVVSIQHDLPTDPPLVTKPGELYVGRLSQILRGVANIKFVVEEMKKVQPNADYDKLTMVGHSMGGDITLYFAKQYPDEIKKVVTLDNLHVPFLADGKFKILSFRSKDPQFKADPGVIPDAVEAEKAGITVVTTGFQHNDMRDTGSDVAKSSIQDMLDKFLKDEGSSGPSSVDVSKSVDPKTIEPTGVETQVGAVSNSGTQAATTEALCREKLRRLGVVLSYVVMILRSNQRSLNCVLQRRQNPLSGIGQLRRNPEVKKPLLLRLQPTFKLGLINTGYR
jgi:dienelactone hydrolase